MNRNICTTQEQAARLLRCGVSADTADMARYEDNTVSMMPWDWTTGSYGGTFPAWSLSALLGLLPKKIDDEYKSRLYTFIIKYEHTFPDSPWQIKYESARLSKSPLFFAKDPIEACVKAIEWLTENNYKLNEIN